MANKQVKVKLVRENAQMPERKNGNWFDIYTSGARILKKNEIKGSFKLPLEPTIFDGIIHYNEGDVVILYLGIATDLGKGYEANMISRSSFFMNTGLLLSNSIGLMDDCFCGDKDEWRAVCYATRAGALKIGDRHMQFTVKKTGVFDLEEVETLGNANRGGYGSTGK